MRWTPAPIVIGCLLGGAAVVAQVAQNPSPMSDTTRPHPRVAETRVPGTRAALSLGELYLPPRLRTGAGVPLLVHFHGASWLIEHHVHSARLPAALVTINLGAGSARYAAAFEDPDRLAGLMAEASDAVAALTNRRPEWTRVTLSAFSAGYGAVRAILGSPQGYARVDTVLLVDGLHAPYAIDGDPAAPRATDPPLDSTRLDVFLRFAADAARGRKRLWVTHSEVYPGTYASTTETADAMLEALGLGRRPVLRRGPIGMQQLSEARTGGFALAGFAGNSAPDHLDHLYALGEWFRRWQVAR